LITDGGPQAVAKNNTQWLEYATAEAFKYGTHNLIRTNMRQPKVGVLSNPGQRMQKWDPRGPLAKAMWNKIICNALSGIKYRQLENAVVLTVIRAPYPRFDPININPQFALEVMINCKLITAVSPEKLLYVTIGSKNTQFGTDFYIGSPTFLSEMMQIIKKTLGDSWEPEALGNDYCLIAQTKETSTPQKVLSRQWPITRAVEEVTGKSADASLSIGKTHLVFKTNICPPKVGILVPQGFLPFSVYAPWVKEARGLWMDLLEKHSAVLTMQTIKKAAVLIVFRTQSPQFDPINFDIRVIINTLVTLDVIKDDSFDTLVCFITAQQCDTDGGIDIYVGPPEFLQEIVKIMVMILRWTEGTFSQK